MKAKASCHVNYSWCLAQRGGRGGLWKPLSSGKFAYVDSRVGRKVECSCARQMGCTTFHYFLIYFLYFLSVAKNLSVLRSATSVHRGMCVCRQWWTLDREAAELFKVWPEPFSCSRHSPFRLEVCMGYKESQGSNKKLIHTESRISLY